MQNAQGSCAGDDVGAAEHGGVRDLVPISTGVRRNEGESDRLSACNIPAPSDLPVVDRRTGRLHDPAAELHLAREGI